MSKLTVTKFVRYERNDGPEAEIVFERDGDSVTKFVRVSTLMRNLSKDNEREFSFMLQKAAREADRDLAFRKYGKDFRKHCELTSNFWQPLTAAELDILA